MRVNYFTNQKDLSETQAMENVIESHCPKSHFCFTPGELGVVEIL